MGLGYTLFVKPVLTLALALALLSGLYFLPEYFPDHVAGQDAIRRNDQVALARFLDRGLDPNDLAQWRSFPRSMMGRATSEGAGDDVPGLGPANEPLLTFALGLCRTEAAQQLVNAGARIDARGRDRSSALFRAAGCGDHRLVQSLLAHGANPNGDEPDGGTPLWEPTNLGWRRRPFTGATVASLEQAGAARPARPPVRR